MDLFEVAQDRAERSAVQQTVGVDDGSLSVWAARQGIPYVNVEAELGHRERQLEMLKALARVLDSLKVDAPL